MMNRKLPERKRFHAGKSASRNTLSELASDPRRPERLRKLRPGSFAERILSREVSRKNQTRGATLNDEGGANETAH